MKMSEWVQESYKFLKHLWESQNWRLIGVFNFSFFCLTDDSSVGVSIWVSTWHFCTKPLESLWNFKASPTLNLSSFSHRTSRNQPVVPQHYFEPTHCVCLCSTAHLLGMLFMSQPGHWMESVWVKSVLNPNHSIFTRLFWFQNGRLPFEKHPMSQMKPSHSGK